MSSTEFVLAGELISPSLLPPPREKGSKTLTLGPGLCYVPPSTIQASCAGIVTTDARKNAVWLESNGSGRYVPSTGDLVISTVHHSSVDFWHCSITPYTALANLPQLAFEGASKKTRPMLQVGSLVYARVAVASRHMDPELECVHPSTGKSEGLGELKGGMVFDISLGMARRLLLSKNSGISILEDLGSKGLRFEIAVGRNGKIWVNSDNARTTIAIGTAIQEIDQKTLTPAQQAKIARTITAMPL